MALDSTASGEIPYFIPPEPAVVVGALGRYLKPMPANVLEAYLTAYTLPGDLALDPFAHTDALARAAARTGRKAVLSDLNPLTSFVARTTLLPVTGRDLHLAFLKLAEAKQAEETLAAHLDRLYATRCPRCGGEAVALEFIWESALDQPVGKRCRCEKCDAEGDGEAQVYAVSEEDLARLAETDRKGFHYWYVLGRLGLDDENRAIGESLLGLYPARATYCLAMLVRHLEGLRLGPNLEHVLKLALLECLCGTSKLVSADSDEPLSAEIRLRPARRFREPNVWRYFADTVAAMRRQFEQRGADQYFPRLASVVERVIDDDAYGGLGSPPNAIVLRQAARHLARDLPARSVSLVITAPPGPEHGTFLCLSFLWQGWLFGSQRAGGFEQIPCSRRPVDWGAYFRALTAALHGLRPVLKEGAPVILLFRGETRRQCDAVIGAGIAAGLRFRRVLTRPSADPAAAEDGQDGWADYVVEFRHSAEGEDAEADEAPLLTDRALETAMRHQLGGALSDVMAARAEPTPLHFLYVAATSSLAESGALKRMLAARDYDGAAVSETVAREVSLALERGERKRAFQKVEGASNVWALLRPPAETQPLSDRVELAVYNLLSTKSASADEHVLRLTHSLFHGFATPDEGWAAECLASHGARRGDGTWTLARGNQLARRVKQHSLMVAVLVELGHRFGFSVWVGREEQKRTLADTTLGDMLTPRERCASPTSMLGNPLAAEVDVLWYEDHTPVFLFEVEWMATLGEALSRGRAQVKNLRRYIVLADERARLVQSKLRRWPWLRRMLLDDGWEFITYRRLIAFAERDDASRFSFGGIVGLPPASEQGHRQLGLL